MESEGCEVFPHDIDKIGEMTNSKEFYSYNREINGYKIIVEGGNYPEKSEEIVTCKNGVYRKVYNNVYSENEKNVLVDENHCLSIYHKNMETADFNALECESHLLLDSSKKAGLECGYFTYIVKLESKNTISFITCYLFNLNLFSKMSEIKAFNTMFNYQDLEYTVYSMGYESEKIKNYTT